MKFTKMHGLGNDYVFINGLEESVNDPPTLARRIADRHLGVGSDGLILIRPSATSDVRMEMYNADGCRAEMCGNGIRCLAKYAVEHGVATGPEVQIETDCGVKSAVCAIADGHVASVRVDMGPPVWDAASIPSNIDTDRIIDHPWTVANTRYTVTCVSMGNPHAVVFVDDVAAVDLESVGPLFERAPEFPERINAHFVQVDDRARITMRTWERGSGATKACGSGACAVCVAGAITQRTDRAITARLPGGELYIEWTPDDHVHLTGPAAEVFTGDWPDERGSFIPPRRGGQGGLCR